MKIEVRCPACEGSFLLDIDTLPTGIPCPGCGNPLDSAPATMAIDLPASETAGPEPAGDVAEEYAGSATAVATPAARGAAEIVCPRCQLHFKPRAGAQARARESTDRAMILIVEDLVYFREIAAEALSEEYEVQGVATKEAAKAVLSRRKVDLMVLDLTLDGGEAGLDLLRELSAKPCPILIYTAQDESEMYGDSWDELKELGADDIVIKGMNVGDELVRKVGALLGRHWDAED